ncbi:MAG: hypothetical protein JST16_03365 [Bdellovibrionales bacterium]|nr:hypothetical protein [Bdellovibrionales bacterium]
METQHMNLLFAIFGSVGAFIIWVGLFFRFLSKRENRKLIGNRCMVVGFALTLVAIFLLRSP